MSRTDHGKWQDDAEAWMAFYEDDQRSGGHMCNDAGYAFAQGHAGNLAPAGEPRPYTAQQVFAVLKALGYGAGQADLAMTRAMSRDSWPLSRHVVRYDGEAGTYTITPRSAS